MRIRRKLEFSILMFAAGLQGAAIRAIIPNNGVAPIGPYTPGVSAGDYLYVSGQGAKRPDGQMPATFESQVRQTLVEREVGGRGGRASMKNVVYTQVYLDDIGHFVESPHIPTCLLQRPGFHFRSKCALPSPATDNPRRESIGVRLVLVQRLQCKAEFGHPEK
jgi:2-iminobutanoate/2-iminopropanoate deaminase